MPVAAKKVLVTGADGFIGSHLVEALVREGYHVRAMVLYNSFGYWGWLDRSPEKIKKELEVVAGDIRDRERVSRAAAGIDIVFHLASLISIPYSYRAAESFIDTNIKGTMNLLTAAREHGVKKFLHTSTSEIYGTAQKIPIDEHHPVNAQSPYAATKIAADCLAESFYRSFDLPVTVIRPFNTYGPRQSARAVIPTVITQLAAGRKKVLLGALTPGRDFTFVGDTVKAFLAAAKAKRITGETINIGSGKDIPIGELARKIAELMNRDIDIVEDKQRLRPANSEVQRLVCDNSKARRLLSWSPEISLETGLKKTI
ncbi:MAG: NAD-dependent 4,6-dehydratase LegB, partial [Candidatus Zixiibacteriota bacterium]